MEAMKIDGSDEEVKLTVRVLEHYYDAAIWLPHF